jgi:ribosomal protein S18 acetylase RimI-like enzyme
MILRPAVSADAPAIAEIWQSGWRDGHLGHVPDALVAVRTPATFSTRAHDRIADTTVAVVDGSIAGFVMLHEGLHDGEVEQVYVAYAHRGTPVAPALLAEAERLLAAAGHSRAWLAVVAGNARARRFYERCGWVDEGPFDYPAPDADVLVPCHRYTKSVT